MVAAVLLTVGVVVVLLVRRARRRTTLAGLNADRPAFSVEPAKRFTTSLRDHRL